MVNLTLIGMLAGGVGIFLLAVGMLTDGLKLAAGAGLRKILSSWTRTPVHGVFTGFFMTAIVQSSSAITVATIGFVNAGLLNLNQALGIVFGANIGTTITGWLVALIGFEINISALALPIIGVGMLFRLAGGASRWAAIGTALVGFGLFFIGIQTLKDAFEGIVATFDMQQYTMEGFGGLLLYLGLGFLMTVLTQSSNAAIAITLTAASGGVLGIYAAGAMVIGANLGTTSTAVISVIGATANARRVAAAHVLFNGITGVVALILLPLIFVLVNSIAALLNIESEPAVSLAIFHTVFNILGVILMMPFASRLSAFLAARFTTQEEVLGKPLYLDKNVISTPDLAINAAVLELIHLSALTREYCAGALQLQNHSSQGKKEVHDAILKLVQAIGEFVMYLQRSRIPVDVADVLPDILRCSQYYLTSTELAKEIIEHRISVSESSDRELLLEQQGFYDEVLALLQTMDIESVEFSSIELMEATALLKKHYDLQKESNLKVSVSSDLPITFVSELLESNGNVRRMATQLSKGTLILSQLQETTNSEAREKQEQDALHKDLVGD